MQHQQFATASTPAVGSCGCLNTGDVIARERWHIARVSLPRRRVPCGLPSGRQRPYLAEPLCVCEIGSRYLGAIDILIANERVVIATVPGPDRHVIRRRSGHGLIPTDSHAHAAGGPRRGGRATIAGARADAAPARAPSCAAAHESRHRPSLPRRGRRLAFRPINRCGARAPSASGPLPRRHAVRARAARRPLGGARRAARAARRRGPAVLPAPRRARERANPRCGPQREPPSPAAPDTHTRIGTQRSPATGGQGPASRLQRRLPQERPRACLLKPNK